MNDLVRIVEGGSIKDATLRLFSVDQYFLSQSHLKQILICFSLLRGFKVTANNKCFHCNRYGSSKSRSTGKRNFDHTFKYNCPWMIRFKYLETQELTNLIKTDTMKVKNEIVPIVISKIIPQHKLPCQPGPAQLVVTRKIFGNYKSMSDYALQHVVNMPSTDNFVSTNAIRNALSNILPDRVNITSTDYHNLCLRAKIIIKESKASGKDPTTFIQKKIYFILPNHLLTKPQIIWI